MVVNMSNITGANNIAEIFIGMNIQSSGLIGTLSLLVLTVIFLMTLLRFNPPAESFTATAGVMTVISLMFLAMGLTDIVWTIGYGLLLSVSAVALYLQKN